MSFGYFNIRQVFDFQKKLKKFIESLEEESVELNNGFFGSCYFNGVGYFREYIQVGKPEDPIPQIPEILISLKRLDASIEGFIEAYEDEDQ